MPGPHDAKVPAVQRHHLGFAVTLGNRHHRGVDEAEWHIAASIHEVSRPSIVVAQHVDDLKPLLFDVIEEGEKPF